MFSFSAVSQSELIGVESAALPKLGEREMEELREIYSLPQDHHHHWQQNRIIGGEPAAHADHFSFAAVLGEHNPRDPAQRSAICGATFISQRHLVTAKHCLINETSGKYMNPNLYVGGVCLMRAVKTIAFRKFIHKSEK